MLKAKSRLSQLVEAAERGEQVVLKRNGEPVAEIVAVPKMKFPFGFLKDQAGRIPDSLLFNTSDEDFTRV